MTQLCRLQGMRPGRLAPALSLLLALSVCPAPSAAPAEGRAAAPGSLLACEAPPDAELAFRVLKAAYPEGVVEDRAVTNGVDCALVYGVPVPLAGLGRRNGFEALDVASSLACDAAKAGQGFVRCQALLKALYGESEKSDRPPFVWVGLLGTSVPFASMAGASAALRAVGRELDALGLQGAGIARTGDCAVDAAAVRSLRNASSEAARSPHGWGIAVDVRISRPGDLEKVAACFERRGFVWACEGSGCETVHFEYRPEVAAYARLLRGQPLPGKPAGK